jgi:hypothetical protein
VVTLIASLVGVGYLAQDGLGGFTAAPLTPDSTEQIFKPSNPEGQQPSTSAAASADNAGMVSVIVKLDVDSVASYDGGVPGLAATNPAAAGTDKLDRTATVSNISYVTFKDFEVNATGRPVPRSLIVST